MDLEEIAGLGAAHVVIVHHPCYRAFVEWASQALSPYSETRYLRAAGRSIADHGTGRGPEISFTSTSSRCSCRLNSATKTRSAAKAAQVARDWPDVRIFPAFWRSPRPPRWRGACRGPAPVPMPTLLSIGGGSAGQPGRRYRTRSPTLALASATERSRTLSISASACIATGLPTPVLLTLTRPGSRQPDEARASRPAHQRPRRPRGTTQAMPGNAATAGPPRLRDRHAPVDGVRDGGPELSCLRAYPLMILSPTLAFSQTGPRTIHSREIRGPAVADDPVGHIGQGWPDERQAFCERNVR